MRRRSWRRRLLLGVAAIVVLIGGAYLYATRPARLCAQVVRAFQALDCTEVKLGELSFSPWHGLEVLDLEVALQEASATALQIGVPQLPPLLRVAQARVRCNLATLLWGEFRPTEIALRGVAITVVRDPVSGATNWNRRRPMQGTTKPAAVASYPRLTVEGADVQLLTVEDGQLRLLRRLVVDATGQPEALSEDTSASAIYRLRVTRKAGADAAEGSREGGGPTPLVEMRHLDTGEWVASADWMDLESARLLLPHALSRACDDLNLAGRARLERIGIVAGHVREAQLQLAGLRFSLPVEEQAARVAPADRFLQITDARATLSYQPEASRLAAEHRSARIELNAGGRINGAPARLTFSADGLDAAALVSAWTKQQADAARGEDVPVPRYEARVEVESLALPTADDQPTFVSCPRLPPGVRNFLTKYDPHGRVNLRLMIRGKPGPTSSSPRRVAGHTQIEGELEALGASCRYVEFPYRIEDAWGRLRFSGGSVYLEGLHGRHGATRVRADGRVYTTKSWSGFDLTFRSENVALDPDLYAALSPRHRRLWDTADPVGLCDAHVTLHRDEGSADTGPLNTSVHVDGRLLSGSLSVAGNRRLDHADGLFSIAHGVVTLRDLHGYFGDAALRLSGTVDAANQARPPQADVHLEAVGVPVQRVSEIHDARDESIGTIDFQGVGDIWGQVRGNGDVTSPATHYTVHLRDGVLTSFDPTQPWQHTQGWIALSGEQQRIISLAARGDEAWLEAAGTLPPRVGVSTPIALDLRAADTRIERLLQRVVPGRWARVREALGLAGQGSLSMRFESEATDDRPARLSADIHLEAERMKPEPLPLDLNAMKAHLTLRADGLELHQATASYGDSGEIQVSGRAGWEAGSAWSDVRVAARGLEFCDDLIGAMPDPFADLLRRMGPKGRVNATLDRVRMSGAADRSWQIDGRVLFEHADLRLGLPLTDFDGELSGTCRVDPEGRVELKAEFMVDRGQLAARSIERWEGALTRDVGERWVRLEDVRGRLCDGEVVGLARIDPANAAYELSLTLHDLSLEQFLRRPGSDGSPRRGRIDGRVFVRGKAGDDATRRGGGELRIRGASLLGTPVLASVAEATRRANRRISDALERVELRFIWDGSELKFVRAEIHSRELRLVGEGSWNMRDDSLSMTLLGAHPEHWPRVAVLSDLIEVAGQELLQYRVTGTAASPQVQVEPLHNLTEPLRKLLGGEE